MKLSINPAYTSPTFLETWDEADDGQKSLNVGLCTKVVDPFRCYALPDFLEIGRDENGSGEAKSTAAQPKSNAYLSELLDELNELEMNDKRNDLYCFKQSDDLAETSSPAIKAFKKLFYENVKHWLRKFTKIPLDDRVAITASRYGYMDYLLCHDDELEDRRIAFTFYLNPVDWSPDDGGRLELFNCNDKLQPTDLSKSFLPTENTLVIFEVSERSFHQVSEVTNPNRVRWSINGWYHGPPVQRSKLVIDRPIPRHKPTYVEYDELISWINPEYYCSEIQDSISQQFEESSEIELRNFLQKSRYDAVMRELEALDTWKYTGPVNRKFYSAAPVEVDETKFPNLAFCIRLMKSEAIYLLLTQLTGVSLYPIKKLTQKEPDADAAEENNGECSYAPPAKKAATECDAASDNGVETVPQDCEMQLRKFEHKSYTLVSDTDMQQRGMDKQFSLDAQLFFTECEWEPEHGGFTYYVAKDSDEELLTITPRGNSLALTCCDEETVKFVKYINHSAAEEFGRKNAHFCDLAITYYEADSDACSSSDD